MSQLLFAAIMTIGAFGLFCVLALIGALVLSARADGAEWEALQARRHEAEAQASLRPNTGLLTVQPKAGASLSTSVRPIRR